MPISFTTYSIEDGILYRCKGLLNSNIEQVKLYRVMDVSARIDIVDKIFKQGSIIIKSEDKTCPTLVLENIPKPKELLKYLNSIVEKERARVRLKSVERTEIDTEENEYEPSNFG